MKAILKQAEAEHLATTLRACEGDRRATAERLGVSEITLYRRLKEHDLS